MKSGTDQRGAAVSDDDNISVVSAATLTMQATAAKHHDISGAEKEGAVSDVPRGHDITQWKNVHERRLRKITRTMHTVSEAAVPSERTNPQGCVADAVSERKQRAGVSDKKTVSVSDLLPRS